MSTDSAHRIHPFDGRILTQGRSPQQGLAGARSSGSDVFRRAAARRQAATRPTAVPLSDSTRTSGRAVGVEPLETRVLLAGNGLLATYHDNPDFTGASVTRVDATVNFDWGRRAAISGWSPYTYSVRWTGQVQAPAGGTYTFYTSSDDGVRLWVDGKLLVDDWNNQAVTENAATITLEAGRKYDIGLEYYQYTGKASAKLLWSGPGITKQVVPQSALYTPAPGVRAPFNGTAATIGQTIQAEDFDRGGPGVSYHDADAMNSDLGYRAGGVDVTPLPDGSGGHAVTSTRPGEWVEYTINVPTGGNYSLNTRLASATSGGTFHVEFNGTDKTGPIAVPATGSDDAYQTVRRNVTLDAGYQTMRVVFDSADAEAANGVANVDWFLLTAPILMPGSGFTAATPQPAAAGTPGQPGYDANAIARWDVVPYQTFDGDFNVGVVAFHMNGIEKVSFSVNDGPWVDVYEMTLNPQTNVVEYWTVLDAANFSHDGVVEVRAVAYPKVGEPRVLQGPMTYDVGASSLTMTANAQDTFRSVAVYVSPTGNDLTGDGTTTKPFASIMKAARAVQDRSGTGTADGGTVYLMPGEYVYGTYSTSLTTNTAERWLTIMPAPTVARDQVRLVSSGSGDGIRTKLVRLYGLTIAPSTIGPIINSNGPLEDYLWLDNCYLTGLGRTVDSGFLNKWTAYFATDSTVTNSRDGFGNVALARGALVKDIGSDAFQNPGMVLNSTVDGIDNRDTTFHADVAQINGVRGNIILYGLRTQNAIRAQGLFADGATTITGMAVVDCYINNRSYDNPDSRRVFQFGSVTQHMYIRNSSFVGVATWRTDLGFVAVDVVLEGVSFDPAPPPQVDGVTYR